MAAIGAFCIGNELDLNAAMWLGIQLFNAPFSNTRRVVEMVLAQIIMLMREVAEKNAILHRGGSVNSVAQCTNAVVSNVLTACPLTQPRH